MDWEAFLPHQFGPNEDFVDLYHVYDNLSQTPYRRGGGIWCGDPDRYIMNPWHVITPEALMRHSDWSNREPTQFISFYDDHSKVLREATRRIRQQYVPGGQRRNPASVYIAHVRVWRETKLWFFSRSEMLRMMRFFGGDAALIMQRNSDPNEWYVYGDVPDENVVNRNFL